MSSTHSLKTYCVRPRDTLKGSHSLSLSVGEIAEVSKETFEYTNLLPVYRWGN